MKKTYAFILLALVMVYVGMAGPVHAATVQVSWSANAESDLAGYKVYWGTSSGAYAYTVNAGQATSVNVPNLSAGGSYYFAVTAYDTSGNESGYSQEVRVVVPESGSGGTGGLPAAGTDSDTDGIPDQIEDLWGLDALDPLDSLDDADGDGVANLVEYMAGTSAVDAADYPANDNILKDIIGQAGVSIDLSSVNPDGAYFIVPLDPELYPDPLDNAITLAEPGAYLYNVLDSSLNLVYRLRISVTGQLSASGAYEPGSFLSIADQLFGISIELPGDALFRSVTIGIGGSAAVTASAARYVNGVLQFDLLPYGLLLSRPARVTVDCEYTSPAVQRYDDASASWESVDGVEAAEGKVSFSTDKLGTFKVVSSEAVSGVDGGGGGGGGGGMCFISAAGM